MDLISIAAKKSRQRFLLKHRVYVYRTTDGRNSGNEHIGTNLTNIYSVSPTNIKCII